MDNELEMLETGDSGADGVAVLVLISVFVVLCIFLVGGR